MKQIFALFTLSIFIGCTSVASEKKIDSKDPTWAELVSFLGLKKDDSTFQAFSKKYKLKESTKGPSGSFSTDGHSASLLYRKNIFVRIIVNPQHYAKSLRKYSGKLPYDLMRQDTFLSVKKKFEKPSYVQGESVLHFKNKKLGFHFMNGKISEITLDYDQKK